MASAERLLEAAAVEITTEPPEAADSRWCLAEYVAELGQRFEAGFDPARGNAIDEAAMRPPAGAFLVARLHGEPVGCGAQIANAPAVAEIKRMWTSPGLRGLGVAGRILAKLEEVARDAGYARVRLDTNRALTEARAMYRKAGYQEIARYNDNPYADHWFEKDLSAR